MRILITGARGFVGWHVVRELEKEHELFMPTHEELDLLNHGRDAEGYWAQDAASEIGCYCTENEIDAVVHLAATVAGLPGNIGNQGKFMYNNLQMALNIFEGARIAGVKKVVNLGSVCGYHDKGPKPFREENYWLGLPHESNRGYGMAKRASIMLGIEYERQYNMDITNLVPINLVGEYDRSDHVIVDLIKKFETAEDSVTLWGTGDATREFCYAGDLARAISLSLCCYTGAWPINIGTGTEISIKDLASKIKEIGNYSAEIVWDTSKPEGQASRRLDITRAKKILNWEPLVSLDEAILRTIRWYRDACVR